MSNNALRQLALSVLTFATLAILLAPPFSSRTAVAQEAIAETETAETEESSAENVETESEKASAEEAPAESKQPAEEGEPQQSETTQDAQAAEPQSLAPMQKAPKQAEGSETPAEAAQPAESETAEPESDGQADLDKATELKLGAKGLKDLNRVVDLLDSAIEKGLDEGNTEFAEGMLVATLMQRATALSNAVLSKPVADPRRDPKWTQVRLVALGDLQRATQMDDSLTEAYMLIGRLHTLPLGDPGAARRALGKVVRDPDISADQRGQAYALRGTTQTDDARQLADFTKAIESSPEKAEYYLLRLRNHLKQKDTAAARADAMKAIELDPENAAAHEQMGLVLLAEDKTEEAIAEFDKASELAPKALSPYQYRGELYKRLGDEDKALQQLDKAIELSPGNLASRMLRAQILVRTEQYERALKDVEAVLKLQPGSLQAHLMRTGLLDSLGREEEAIAALKQLAKAVPDRPEIHLQLAASYMESGQTRLAIESLGRVLEINEDNETALRLRGDLYLAIGKHEEALADFKKSYSLKPDDSGLLNNYAWTLATSPYDNLRDGDFAIELALKACEMTDYKAPHILSTLAAAYAESGDFDRAIKWAEKAVELESQNDDDQNDEQIAAELASYKEKKPWRELQQEEDNSPAEAADENPADEAAVPEEPMPEPPEPARTIEF